MSTLLHIAASPRGLASQSLHIAETFLDTYRQSHPEDTVTTWDIWDGTVPEFGPAAAGAKMTVFGGGTPEGEQGAAWQAAQDAFARGDTADRLLLSVPMWNAGIAVWGPALGPEFGRDFQSTYLDDWLRWTGIDDISNVPYHPTLTGDAAQAMQNALAAARDIAKTF